MTDLYPWFRLILRRRRRLLLGGLLMFMTILAGVGLLALSGWFITATALTGLVLAAGGSAYLNIYAPGGGIRFFALGRTVSRYLERLYNHDTVLRLLADIRVVFFERLTAAPPASLGHRRAADWLNRLTRDIDTLDTLYLQLVAPPAMALLALMLLAVIMMVVAPLLLWALLPLALLPLTLWGVARSTLSISCRQGFREEALRAQLVDAIEGVAELQAAHRWQSETGSLLEAGRQLDRERQAVESRTAIANGATLLAIQLAVVLSLWLGLTAWQEGTLSGPVALMFSLAVLGLGEAFTGLPAAFGRLGATLGAAGRLNGVSHGAATASAPALSAAPLTLSSLAAERNGEQLFEPLNLTLAPGQRLALTGRSGCGKSTLLDFLAGLTDDVQGTLALAGQPVKPMVTPGWRGSVSYLSQHTHFFSDSLRANLAMARPDVSDAELRSVLHAVDLSDLIEHLPQGLDTWVGDQGRHLSGGERRRLGLARALLRPCWLLLLDEPFTGLDETTRERIKGRIEPWLEGRTCVFAAHSADAMPQADETLSLDHHRDH